MSYPSARKLADRLSSKFSDPQNTRGCPVCLAKLSYRLTGDRDLVPHIPRLRVDCHALFDACVLQLVFPHEPGGLERLALQLRANRGRCSLHARGGADRSADEHLDDFWGVANQILMVALQTGNGAFEDRMWSRSKLFSDRRGRWPAHVDQLFPDGARTAVDTLVSHCERYISVRPLDTLYVMTMVARAAILPVLAEEAVRLRLIAIILKTLDPEASGISERAPWLVAEGDLHARETATRMLEALMKGPGALPEDAGMLFFSGHESSLIDVVGRVSESLAADHPLRSDLQTSWFVLSNRSGVRLPPHLAPPLTIPPKRDEHYGRNAVIKSVYYLSMLCMRSRSCAGPGCTLSAFENAGGRPFPQCARCKVPRYCSRACQRADWKGGVGVPVPHKRLCGAFGKLGASECPQLTLEEFTEAFVRAEPQLDDADVHALNEFVNYGIRAILGHDLPN